MRTVSASPFIFDVTVSSTSGVITTPPEGLAREVLPLFTGVNILHGVNTRTPFVVPPALSCSVYRPPLPRSRCRGTRHVVRDVHRCFQPLRGKTSPPTGEALLPPPADDCLVPGLDDPNTAVRCEPFPGSEYPSSLPACSTVRAVLSAGPSGAPDWVGFQDLYDTARGIIDLCECPIFVRPLRRDDFPIRGTKRDDTSSPCYVQILGVWRSAVYRWKPMYCCRCLFRAGSRKMSGVAPAPVLACHT